MNHMVIPIAVQGASIQRKRETPKGRRVDSALLTVCKLPPFSTAARSCRPFTSEKGLAVSLNKNKFGRISIFIYDQLCLFKLPNAAYPYVDIYHIAR